MTGIELPIAVYVVAGVVIVGGIVYAFVRNAKLKNKKNAKK